MKISKLGFLTILTIAGLVAFNSTAQAQEKKKEESKPAAPAAPPAAKGGKQDRMRQIGDLLGLTDEQREKIAPVFQEQAKKMQETYTDAKLSQEEKRTKIGELRTTYNDKIKALLTPEQVEKWNKLQETGGKAKKSQ